jgi:hypothetical protein
VETGVIDNAAVNPTCGHRQSDRSLFGRVWPSDSILESELFPEFTVNIEVKNRFQYRRFAEGRVLWGATFGVPERAASGLSGAA